MKLTLTFKFKPYQKIHTCNLYPYWLVQNAGEVSSNPSLHLASAILAAQSLMRHTSAPVQLTERRATAARSDSSWRACRVASDDTRDKCCCELSSLCLSKACLVPCNRNLILVLHLTSRVLILLMISFVDVSGYNYYRNYFPEYKLIL